MKWWAALISQGQFRSPFQRILGGLHRGDLDQQCSWPQPCCCSRLLSPAYPAHPAHGWFLILMLSWGGSLLSQCPACSWREAGNIHVPAGSPESQLWSRQAHRTTPCPLPHNTSVPQHTPTSEQSPQLPIHAVVSCHYLRTSHQGWEAALYSGFWGCGFPTLSPWIPGAEHPWQCLRFPRWTRSRDLPLSLSFTTYTYLWFQRKISLQLWVLFDPMMLVWDHDHVTESYMEDMCACRRNGLDLTSAIETLFWKFLSIYFHFRSIFADWVLMKQDGGPFYKVAGERKAVLKDLVNHFFIKYLLHVY